MLILVTGDRFWTAGDGGGKTIAEVLERVDKLAKQRPYWGAITLVHGDARGVDRLAGVTGDGLGWTVKCEPAKWDVYHKAAGAIRNRVMLDMRPDLVLAFHDNIDQSRGTRDCMNEALKRGIPVRLFNRRGEITLSRGDVHGG